MKTIIPIALLALSGCAATTSPAYHPAPGYGPQAGVDYVIQAPPKRGWAIKGAGRYED